MIIMLLTNYLKIIQNVLHKSQLFSAMEVHISYICGIMTDGIVP